MTDIRGKRALITGAAGGIGQMLAAELARAGAHLVLWDIDEDGLRRVQRELADAGHEADVYACNLADRDSVKAVAATTRASTSTGVSPPTRMISPVSRTRRSFAWRDWGPVSCGPGDRASRTWPSWRI